MLWAASSRGRTSKYSLSSPRFWGTAKVRFRRVALRAANQSQLSRPRRAHSACLRECRERPVSCRLAPLTKSVLNQGAVASIKDCPKIQRSVELIRNIPKMAAETKELTHFLWWKQNGRAANVRTDGPSCAQPRTPSLTRKPHRHAASCTRCMQRNALQCPGIACDHSPSCHGRKRRSPQKGLLMLQELQDPPLQASERAGS